MEAILAGMVEGVMVVDGGGRVQLVNDAARQMLSLAAPSLTASNDADRYLHVIRHPAVVGQFDAALAGGRPADAELTLPAGRVAIARAVPLADGGAVLVLHDITSLRAADRVRRDFIANASHELRTPLTAIRGYAEALRDDGLAAADRQRFLEVIDRHAGRMNQLVHDLLRLARLDSGQEAPVTRSAVDVAALFERLRDDFRARLTEKGQRLVTEVRADAGSIVTDAAKLEEILRNIVENAVNYSPQGTDIQLTAARRDDNIEFCVEDHGPGIPPEDLQRIFERFYRVDKARSRDSGGTGLGLSIAKHLADRLGGRIEAGNRPSGGASFRLSVPMPAAS
jgi:two-component system phosphate regulon sensor histidine kinase PhoR